MNENKAVKSKIIFVFCLFAIAFSVVIGKALKIQVIDRADLLARAHSQFFRENKVYPKRGNIFDRNGNPLAINIQTYSIFAMPKNMSEGYKEISEIKKIIPELDSAGLLREIRRRNKFTWIARKIQLEDDQVEKLKALKGVYLESVPKRLYPNHELASQMLGFVGVDNKGLSGIEYLFDEELKGKPKILRYIIDNKGRPIKFESTETQSSAKDITLTIDKELQAIAEKALKDAVIEHEANMGGIGVMDSETGEILAMANYPTYDPNEVEKSEVAHRRLAFVSDPFEPGSTFKSFTVASALENKIARLETNYYCELGRLQVEDHVITESDSNHKYEWLTVSDILKYSSNIGTTKIAFDLTFPKLKETLTKFHIGQKTGIQLPSESRGIFTDEKNVPPLHLSNMSFGQGVATTGIQMLSAYSAIANGGYFVYPTLIKNARADEKRERILSEETVLQLEKMLVEAVEDGTGTKAKIPYYVIAGKTSTAQRPDKNGGYSGYVPGFIGYPVNVSKRFVIYVYVDKPKGKNYYGNAVAAPVFKKVAQYMLYKSKDLEAIATSDVEIKNNVDSIQVKHSSARVLGSGVAPNFIGLDKRSSRALAEKLDIKTDSQGIGVVSEQRPAPGESLGSDTVLKLIFSPPSYE